MAEKGAGRAKRLRCAIYTRKSSDEGLEQEFNSLHAQREACEAFIASQRHEGWHELSAPYDDGGFSGGTMDRPALQRRSGNLKRITANLIPITGTHCLLPHEPCARRFKSWTRSQRYLHLDLAIL
jgi:Resolvase, N terminal domain